MSSTPSSSNGLLVAMLLVLDSLHFVFARLLLPQIAPGVSVLYVLAVSTVQVGLFGVLTRRIHWQMARRHVWLFLAIGALIAISTVGNYEAVAFIDPGTASLLSQTSVLFGLAFGLFWLRDRLTPRQIAGALLAVVGVFVITFQPGDYLRLGALITVSSALMYALHAALAKRYGGDMDFVDFFFFRLLFTTGALFCLSLARGALALPSPRAFALILLVGTVDVVLSRTLYYIALRRLKLSVHTLVMTLSPIAAIAWSVLLFGTMPSLQQLLGGTAVITGVMIVSRGRAAVAQRAIQLEGSPIPPEPEVI
jgi:drug/metabolite transporter (DMT)-like permease